MWPSHEVFFRHCLQQLPYDNSSLPKPRTCNGSGRKWNLTFLPRFSIAVGLLPRARIFVMMGTTPQQMSVSVYMWLKVRTLRRLAILARLLETSASALPLCTNETSFVIFFLTFLF
jgi:hypothetical protein